MNYRIVGKENRIFGPYTIDQLQSFADQGKLRENMCLLDESSNRHYAKDIVKFPVSQNTVDLTYLSNSAPSNGNNRNNNSDYVDLTDLSNDYTHSNQSNNVDFTNNTNFDRYTMISNDGVRYGPYSIDELQRFVSENRVAPNTILIGNNRQSYQARDILTFSNNSSYSFNGNDSGMGSGSTLPYQLSGLNWGAFFLPLFWGISHNTWVALICLIPSLGWFMSFILLFKGNEWAWQNRRWTSPQEFVEVQRIWNNWGIGITIAILLFGLSPLLFLGCCGI